MRSYYNNFLTNYIIYREAVVLGEDNDISEKKLQR